MIIEINLTQLKIEELEELSHLINNSIDYSVETEGMEMNFEASQNIDYFMSTFSEK